jgi:hypothetical protein
MSLTTRIMKKTKFRFFVTDLSEGKKKAYKAVIPDLGNAIVYSSSRKELEEGIQNTIEFTELEKKFSSKKQSRRLPSNNEF